MDIIGQGYLREAGRHLADLRAYDMLTRTDARYLAHLIDEDKDPALLAMVEQAGENSTFFDDEELQDSLVRLACRWRRDVRVVDILDFLARLCPLQMALCR